MTIFIFITGLIVSGIVCFLAGLIILAISGRDESNEKHLLLNTTHYLMDVLSERFHVVTKVRYVEDTYFVKVLFPTGVTERTMFKEETHLSSYLDRLIGRLDLFGIPGVTTPAPSSN